jgi:organic hydroperoxide reductase OsmC/OhrA
MWSPEEFFVASVGSCLMSTFLYFAEAGGIEFRSYNSTSTGIMEKTSEGLRFTKIEVDIEVGVGDPSNAGKVMKLEKKLEKYCPISASLCCPVSLDLKTVD